MKDWVFLGTLISTLFIFTAEAGVTGFVPKSFLASKTSHESQQTLTGAKNACAAQIANVERKQGIPNNLLLAISKVETGRRLDTQEFVAWAWSINVDGKGYFYETKAEAIEAVKEFQRKGHKSIDVGCMQVNLAQHPNAFKTLELAFDPHHNVTYAAQYLKSLYADTQNWHTAVSHYHSRNPTYHVPYHKKVMAMWDTKTVPAYPVPTPQFGKWKRIQPKILRVEPSGKRSVMVASNSPRVRRITTGGGGVRIIPTTFTGVKVKAVKRIR